MDTKTPVGIITITPYKNSHDPLKRHLVHCRRCDKRWAASAYDVASQRREAHVLRHLEIDGEVPLAADTARRHCSEDWLATMTEIAAGPARRAWWRVLAFLPRRG